VTKMKKGDHLFGGMDNLEKTVVCPQCCSQNQWSLTPLILFAHYFSLGVILIGKEGG